MHDEHREKSALVLSGGGAFGAYEVGVINALYGGTCRSISPRTLDPDIFVGTSVGGFNAAVLAMNQGGAQASAELLHRIWVEDVADRKDGRGNGVYRVRGDARQYLDPRIPGTPLEQFSRLLEDAGALGNLALRGAKNLVSGSGSLINRLTGAIDISVLLDTAPFQHLVRKWIDPDVLRASLDDSNERWKSLIVKATNWGNGEAEDFNFETGNANITWDAIRASAAIPALFPMVTMNKQYFIDGGAVMNTPVSPAIDAGASEIHVISLDPIPSDLSGAYTGDTLTVLSRVYVAMMGTKIGEDIKSAKWVNDGLDALERIDAGKGDSEDRRRFIRVAGRIRDSVEDDGNLPRRLTIHHYHPKKALGGLAGMLNFDLDAIEEMISRGEADARDHKCGESGCLRVLPVAVGAAARASGGGD